MFSTSVSAMTIDLGRSFFPKKDIIIDADSPNEITVKYKLRYYISDGCAYDIVTSYKLGGCPRKKYKTYEEDSKYILKIDKSSAKAGHGAQVLRLSVKQKERGSFDIIPVVEILEGNEDTISHDDPWFGAAEVKLKSRDRVVNETRENLKKSPQQYSGEKARETAISQ
ncbi:hypothetical protein DAY19_02710 [Halobacteriovorax vibrionivorans]|uniref:Uncharacterized protein n=1 Tax=Halobacteriovorax vibrionivorans TaxID=2152716 RepID=A0ABY0IIB9_9BACT|nr:MULTISPECIES: hypothetical protein [Halobacteriovorax]RZF22701.1 hypothetical protein DAY19_02710 [Halobacteriovorax vibrionivorans]TGD46722.1 hypothetical protein EP118_11095 [Halobacteriovorax sp. Y22]